MLASKDTTPILSVALSKTLLIRCTATWFMWMKKTRSIYRYWKGNRLRRNAINGLDAAHPTFYVRRESVQQLGVMETHFIRPPILNS
jgi:hypothetical protein